MWVALWQGLAAFLLQPAPYMLAQAWFLVLALWWTFHLRRVAARFRHAYLPGAGLVLTLAAGLVTAWALFDQPGRYTPWWLLRAFEVGAGYFLLWAWTLPQHDRRITKGYRGLVALVAAGLWAGSWIVHLRGPLRWPALETAWLVLGLLMSAGAWVGTLVQKPPEAAWPRATAVLLALGFAVELLPGRGGRGAARLAELAVYPLLLWWPAVYSPCREARDRWRKQLQTLKTTLHALRTHVRKMEAEIAAQRAPGPSARAASEFDWCERGGYPFWQAFASTLRTLQHTLHSLSGAAVWRALPPSQRDTLLHLEAVVQFHQHALEVAARREPSVVEWSPWSAIWNHVLQAMGLFAQRKDQILGLALPDEIFPWLAPEAPAYNALYFVLARALWVSPPHSEILVRGKVVHMTPGGLGVLLEIADQGPSLDDDAQVRVFFATNGATQPEAPTDAVGSDVGLRLARRQLMAVQGSLWVTAAQAGQGTTIAVLIPTRRMTANPEATSPP